MCINIIHKLNNNINMCINIRIYVKNINIEIISTKANIFCF